MGDDSGPKSVFFVGADLCVRPIGRATTQGRPYRRIRNGEHLGMSLAKAQRRQGKKDSFCRVRFAHVSVSEYLAQSTQRAPS
jgi:hypothetical protein